MTLFLVQVIKVYVSSLWLLCKENSRCPWWGSSISS